jgi:hypothetical protein
MARPTKYAPIPVKPWHVVVIVSSVALVVWWQTPAQPSPPDFTEHGFTSIRVVHRGMYSGVPDTTATSNDPAIVAELAKFLRTGKSVVVCRCAVIGSVEFCRPDGTSERIALVPAHDDDSVEFRSGPGRFRVNRERFLQLVAPLGLSAQGYVKALPPREVPEG